MERKGKGMEQGGRSKGYTETRGPISVDLRRRTGEEVKHDRDEEREKRERKRNGKWREE